MALWRVLDVLNLLTIGTVAAIVPPPWRDRIADEHDVDVPLFSLALGAVEAPLGVLAFLAGWIVTARGGSAELGMLLLENWRPGLSTIHFQGAGLVAGLAWMLHPASWACLLVGLTGGTRLVAFAAARAAVAEPLAVLAAFCVGRARGAASRGLRRLRYGAPGPDRVLDEDDGELLVLSCRPKPEWNERVTIEVGGRFYRLVGRTVRREGATLAIAYRLREREPTEVIRRLVRHAAD